MCRGVVYSTKLTDDSNAINRAELVESDEASFAFDSTRNSRRIAFSTGGQWGDNDRSQRDVHFIRRNNQAGTSFLYLASDRWVKVDQNDVEAAAHHSHSSSSNLVAGQLPSINSSSP